MSAAPDPFLEPAQAPDEARHLSVVPPTPPPTPAPARPLVRPDLMWLAVVGPIGALGVAGLVAARLVQAVGVGWTVGAYALVVALCVVIRAGWGR